ncbi:MAG: hypothetical protein AMDU2_EPLC00006G0042 [Thermoplasmatales archaeon E-plasma]|jgi:hypothetical protein|nr:MAG: hypothetical protein AMDU2_EPLC00006G0042 [Thermoplasmatales archaeon E-plasma]
MEAEEIRNMVALARRRRWLLIFGIILWITSGVVFMYSLLKTTNIPIYQGDGKYINNRVPILDSNPLLYYGAFFLILGIGTAFLVISQRCMRSAVLLYLKKSITDISYNEYMTAKGNILKWMKEGVPENV